jgi:tetratricopeptide (TPR) repeat protein
MKEIVVFFKAVEPRRLSDPGPQLNDVLDFKRSLEQERSLLFETFDIPEAFGEKLRRHIAKWTRDHEQQTAAVNPTLDDRKGLEKDSEIQAGDPTDLRFIEKLKSQDGYTEAEKRLADDVTIKRDMQSFDRYGIFLIQEERYSDALTLYQQMHDLANGAGNLAWSSTAIARIGGVYRIQGRTAEAHATLLNALSLKEKIGDIKGASSVHGWLGDLYSRQKKADVAIEHYAAALKGAAENNPVREAELKWKMAKCYAELGEPEKAKTAAMEAEVLFKQQGNKPALLAIKSWRKARKLR